MGHVIRLSRADDADRLWRRLYKEVGRTAFFLVLRECLGTNAVGRQLIGQLPPDRAERAYARLVRAGYFRAESDGSYVLAPKGQQFLKDVEAADQVDVTCSWPGTTATEATPS